jgi:F-type H+-transporting ATPase subunit gamma
MFYNFNAIFYHEFSSSFVFWYCFHYVSIFRACAESLAGENASRLAAMERAERNINQLLEDLHSTYHRLRQNGIDEELFDLISGFEALIEPRH